MGDVAQILAPTAASSVPGRLSSANGGKPGAPGPSAVEIAGMSKEVMNLLKGKNQDSASASLPPIVPTFTTAATTTAASKPFGDTREGPARDQKETRVKVGSKWISSSKRARPWTWAPFVSSSRTDGAMFHHWVRKNVEYTDYPYAKFDIHMDPVVYTTDEYNAHLRSESWTRSETDRLMELARTFECRWPIILDRFGLEYNSNNANINANANANSNAKINDAGKLCPRKIEDLQHRYYGVAATLAQVRIAQEAATEAMTLSAEAAKAAAAAAASSSASAPSGTTAAAAAAATSAAKAAASSAVGGAAASTAAATAASAPTDGAGTSVQAAAQQEKANNLLLESAAARALATSSKQHQPLIAHIGTGTTNKMFDYTRERERRRHLDRLWRRSKDEEEEELRLRKELKTIEAQLRKLKKNGGHVLAAGTTAGRGKSVAAASAAAGAARGASASAAVSTVSSSRAPSRTATPVPTSAANVAGEIAGTNDGSAKNNATDGGETIESLDVLDDYFASTAPVPMPHHPYLQSGRLLPPATGGPSGINKSLLTKMDQILGELNIPQRPLPTKRVCDLYDTVRKDVITLVTLQKMLLQREGQLQSKRLRLSRMGGAAVAPEDKVLDEESLFGIAPPPKPAASATSATGSATKSKATKRKTVQAAGKGKVAAKKGVGADGSKSASGNNAGATATTTTTTTKKKTVKRKRKSDASSTSKSPTQTSKSPAAGSTAAKAAARAKNSPAAASTAATKRATAAKPAVVAPSAASAAALPSSAVAVAAAAAAAASSPAMLLPKAPSTDAPKAKAPSANTAAATATESAAKRSRKT